MMEPKKDAKKGQEQVNIYKAYGIVKARVRLRIAHFFYSSAIEIVTLVHSCRTLHT